MDSIPAVVLTQSQLRKMIDTACERAAELAVNRLRSDLARTPEQETLDRLRQYLADPSSSTNPTEEWAHSGIIREIQLTPRGKPKSVAWFMKFQRDSGLMDCTTRKSPVHGRRKEWTFADIRMAWQVYYSRRTQQSENYS
tara:strand:- start:160556 stop:160975 length:420 start_codon:yes stop_codon:yes gene_type:complete